MGSFDSNIMYELESRLTNQPFCADLVKVVELDKDYNLIMQQFEIPKQNRDTFMRACSLIKCYQEGCSMELSGTSEGLRQSIGFVPINKIKTVVLRKTEHISAKDEQCSYGINNYYLASIKSIATSIISRVQRGDTFFSEAKLTNEQNTLFALRLLKNAVEPSDTVGTIIDAVQDLSDVQKEQFATLLEETSLETIISSCKAVVERLKFLAGFEFLISDPISKTQVRERSQLHRILAEHAWIFGERYNLTVDDQSLTEVLNRHMQLLGREKVFTDPVLLDGSRGIIDLMLARRIKLSDLEKFEYLVVELKRPSVAINMDVINQILKYARAVASDERFKDTRTEWNFWAVSNSINRDAEWYLNQANRPKGLIYEDPQGKMKIWAKTWGQIINDCYARFAFFQDRLNYHADHTTALNYLKNTCSKYLPINLKNKYT